MSLKTIISYSCIFFSIIIIILSLATNYWHEYEIPDRKNGFLTVSYHRVGLYEQCSEIHYRWGWDNKTVDDNGCSNYYPPPSVEDKWPERRDALVAMFIIALVLTLVSFVFITVYCFTEKYYFPVGRTAICFVGSAIVLIIGLIIYTDTFVDHNVAFSWSYGAGWSAAVMYIISTILLYADK